MTLLLGVEFVLIMAFLTIAIALNVGLVSCPFCFQLGSFILFLMVRTRLTVSYIDLHLLQPIVVILLG